MKNKSLFILFVLMLSVSALHAFSDQVSATFMTKTSLSGSDNHTLILRDDGSVWGYGSNSEGQLGTVSPGEEPGRVTRSDYSFLNHAVSVATGARHSLVLSEDGRVMSFGANFSGQLGDGTLDGRSNPAFLDLENIVAIDAATDYSLALDSDGNVWTWGSNAFGKLGHGSVGGNEDTPVQVAALEAQRIIAISAGDEHAIALDDAGKVYAWGDGRFGQLGSGQTTMNNANPAEIRGIADVVSISAGTNHILLLTRDQGRVIGFGRNAHGQLGQVSREDHVSPVHIGGLEDVLVIKAGAERSAAITDDGEVYLWGRQSSGANPVSNASPEMVHGIGHAEHIELAENLYAVDRQGSLYQWSPGQVDPTTSLPVFRRVEGIQQIKHYPFYPYVQGNEVIFRYQGSAQEVSVVGSFNEYVPLDMAPVNDDESVWEVTVNVQEGDHFYGFMVNNRWKVDMLNHNRVVNRAGDPFNTLTVQDAPTESPMVDGENVTFYYSSRMDRSGLFERDAQTRGVYVTGSFNQWQREVPLSMDDNHIWSAEVTASDGDHYYRYIIYDRNGDRHEITDPMNPVSEVNAITGTERSVFYMADRTGVSVPTEGISIHEAASSPIRVGESLPLRIELIPGNATDRSVSWRSSDETVLQVSDNGIVTGISGGTAVVSATSGGHTDLITIEVTGSSSILPFPHPDYLNLGEQTGVSRDKEWTVRFNDDVETQTINSANVYILTERGDRVNQVVARPGDRADEVVFALTSNFRYASGQTYFLVIENRVSNRFGEQMSRPGMMKFTVRSN